MPVGARKTDKPRRYRVHVYQTFSGRIMVHAKGPEGLNDLFEVPNCGEAEDYISGMMKEHPSQVNVTYWGDFSGVSQNVQL